MFEMNQLVLSKHGLLSAWEQFANTGQINTAGINATILESWKRSSSAGVDPYQNVEYTRYKYEPQIFSGKLSTIISISHPIVKQTFDIIKGSGFHLFLVNEDAHVIECFPTPRRIINNWSEEIIGTNAIGIAIMNQEPAQVSGAEHYCRSFHGLTSSAVPIVDNDGDLFGALGLVGPVYEDHSHVLSALEKAADKLTDNFTIDDLSHKLISISESLSTVMKRMTDGVLVLNCKGIIESVNSIAESAIDRQAQEVIGHHFSDLCNKQSNCNKVIFEDHPFTNMDVFLKEFNEKYKCESSMQMIKEDSGHIISAVIFIQKNESIQDYCHSSSKIGFNNIIGKSQKLLESIHIARMAANNMSNILLQGESGTGKDIFAQAIHYESPRRSGPFIATNCGAIPHELVSSELFGYVEGAFSGARRGGAPGKFEAARGGTLFLDEIGDMPLESQVSLLRVLQDRKITRVGDVKEIPVDVRIICATNQNLYEAVMAGKFREDLYYRINVIPVYIPPLRERTEDISLLVKYYLSRMGVSSQFITKIIKSSLIEELVNYQWPGNVRELQNVIERIVCIHDQLDPIRLCDLQPNYCEANSISPPDNNSMEISNVKTYKDRKKQLIMQDEYNQIKALMKKHNGNITQVAAEMGFSRVTLYRKLKFYEI